MTAYVRYDEKANTVETRLRALVIAHDAKASGGVNNFLRVMRVCYRKRVAATRFANGPRKKSDGKVARAIRMTKDYLNFVYLLRRRKFDVLHANPSLDLSSTPRELVFVWLGWLFQPQMKRIVFYRGWRYDSFARIRRSNLLRTIFLSTHRRVDRVLVLSQDFGEALVDIGVDPAKIHNTTTMFERSLFEGVVAADYSERKAVLFLARFLPQKGGIELIQAFARIAPRFPDWTLVMGGDGPDFDRMVSAAQNSGIAERIFFPGYVRRETKSQLLNNGSLFVLPTTHSEGMPNAILEAMAAGQVIISTAVGGIKDVVKDKENGTILEIATIDEIERALLLYMNNPKLLKMIGEHNQTVAWANFESTIVADRVAEHYHDCLHPPL